jgi:peroxiredoxin
VSQLVQLHSLLPEDRKDDTVILGVSPDSLDKNNDVIPKVQAKTNQKFGITLLSDADHKVIDRYGLLNEEAAKRNRFLPHPTTYVIDAGGIVRWKFTEKNYRIRPTNEMILEALKKLPSS